jgi:hypothetical protein
MRSHARIVAIVRDLTQPKRVILMIAFVAAGTSPVRLVLAVAMKAKISPKKAIAALGEYLVIMSIGL